jgi:hypothetical protein
MVDIIGAIASDSTVTDQSDVTAPAANVFVRAVVLQTLNDPSTRDEKADASIIANLKNKQYYLRAPRNSLICRILSDRQGLDENSNLVCFPFFSSHVMLPVKAGELVWLFMELPNRPFWISRISEPLHVEDVNFTHGDRRINRVFKGNITGELGNDESGNFDVPRKLKFQNGNPAKPETATILGDQKAFEIIITGSKEYKITSLEPVPRLTKRPGDLVIQGSNNTAIRLGTEMSWNVDANSRPQDSTAQSIASTLQQDENLLRSGLGAIDIVTGRGRFFQDVSVEKSSARKAQGKAQTKSTRPYIEETVIPGAFEVDKNVGTIQDEATSNSKGNNRTNPQEGDPDFLMDASRIYVSTNSEIDKMLGTGPSGIAAAFENPIIEQRGPSVAVKSDHIRIVARKSPLNGRAEVEPDDISNLNPPSNGSIRIVKEGEPNVDLATITIESDGTIQISGSKIFIGRKTDDGGAGTGTGPGESQPYVKYKQLEDLLTKTYDDLKTFVQKLQTNFNTNTTPGFGGPNPALIKSAADECTQFLSAIDSRKSEIETLKSERIFGE